MKFYPVFMRVAGRPCLVVGGGDVAARKVDDLLRADAVVTVVSPVVVSAIAAHARCARLRHHARCYRATDLTGAFLVYAATGDEALHNQIAAEARAAGVLLNVVDRPHLCDFITPAIMERGDLIIATSTSGASPALARRIRMRLERLFGPEYAVALRVLGALRARLTRDAVAPAERTRILHSIVDSPLIDHLRSGERAAVDRLLAATVAADVSLAALGVEIDS
jgi:precorrin-2 dehydrogenase/sirohydrochlorin ferrochelatase